MSLFHVSVKQKMVILVKFQIKIGMKISEKNQEPRK